MHSTIHTKNSLQELGSILSATLMWTEKTATFPLNLQNTKLTKNTVQTLFLYQCQQLDLYKLINFH